MEYYNNKYRIDSSRLKNWDYASPGYYFVTIQTENRECYFGDVVIDYNIHGGNVSGGDVVETQNFASLRATPIGKIAHQYWIEIPNHFPFVILDEFIVMPNHVHGILHFKKPGYRGWEKNRFAPQSQNLPSVIRGYKAAVSKYATVNNIEFAWQPRYHDHVIKSGKRLNIIRQYIKNNPAKWINEKPHNDASEWRI